MHTFITTLAFPDLTIAPHCILLILCEAPSTTKMMAWWPGVPAVVAAQVGKLFCLFPWPALQSLSSHAHIAFVGLTILFLAVKIYKPRHCNKDMS